MRSHMKNNHAPIWDADSDEMKGQDSTGSTSNSEFGDNAQPAKRVKQKTQKINELFDNIASHARKFSY